MIRVFLVLALISLAATAGNVSIDAAPAGGSGQDADYLQYDDGTYAWLTWAGLVRGVWFNTQDFDPTTNGIELEFTEYWMYEHASYPWDTAEFYAEVWNGDVMGPVTQLDQTTLVGISAAPVFQNFSPALIAEQNFWVLENTEMSAGCWPSCLGDATPPTVDHSWYSDDWFVWEPWSDGVNTGDFLFRCQGVLIGALDNNTWGSIKAIF